jgi:hemin uptake protein HemP
VNPPPEDDAAHNADAVNMAESRPASEIVSLSGLPKIIRFDALARCGEEIWIENEGQIYRLRKTRQGKLILTK